MNTIYYFCFLERRYEVIQASRKPLEFLTFEYRCLICAVYVDIFRKALNENATLTEDDLIAKVSIDMQMPLGYVSEKLVDELELLEPFGKGNTKPIFVEKEIEILKGEKLGKNQNVLRDEDIEKIINTYKERKEVEKYCHLANMEEIKENECNLNIPRYVDTFEEEEEIDLNAVQEELERLDMEDKEVTEELNKYLRELGLKELK